MKVANEAAAAAAAARLVRLDAESDARALAPCSECCGSGVDVTVRPSAGRPGLAFPCRACGGVGASAAAVEAALSARLAVAAPAAVAVAPAVRLAAAIAAALAVDVDPERVRVEVDALEDSELATALAVERLTRAPRIAAGSSFRLRDGSGRVLGVAYVEGGAL